jgi:hypothetical protein
MTEDMRLVMAQAIEEFKAQTGQPLFEELQAYLSSTTLRHYVDPLRPTQLAASLVRRLQNAALLTAKSPVALVGSLRFVGWDGEGSAILSWETSTQNASFTSYMPQFEYIVNTALDLNAPGASGFIIISHYPGGYFNPLQFLNPSGILQLGVMLETQFRRRLKAAIMVSMPRAFEPLINMVLKVAKKATREKVLVARTEGDCIEMLREQFHVDAPTLARLSAALDNRTEHRLRGSRVVQTWFPVLDHPYFHGKLEALNLASTTTTRVTAEMHAAIRTAVREW